MNAFSPSFLHPLRPHCIPESDPGLNSSAPTPLAAATSQPPGLMYMWCSFFCPVLQKQRFRLEVHHLVSIYKCYSSLGVHYFLS